MTNPTPGTTLGGLSLYSTDPAALAAFYADLLGVEATGADVYYELSTADATLGVVNAAFAPVAPDGSDRAAAEVTIEVVDVDTEYQRLGHLEGWLTAPQWFDWGRVARLRDPDGNIVSLQERSPATASWRIRDWQLARTAEQLGWHLREAWWWMRHVLDGLSDEEYLWEPVEGCWTIRRSADTWTVDWETPPPSPPPVTTIAWRLTHVQRDLELLGRAAFPSDDDPETRVAPSASEAIHAVRRAVTYLRDCLARADDEDMRRPVHAGRTYNVWGTITHAIIEATHHTAEIGVLRDLYRRRVPETL